jgi:hypothetical protein
MPVSDPLHLYWRPDLVAKVMRRNKIINREDLARRLGSIGRTAVYENLAIDWSGRVKSIPMLVAMCQTFDVDLATLVIEPRRTNGKSH